MYLQLFYRFIVDREGILVAVNPAESVADPAEAPPNLPFLEILTEFTNKLLKQDKKVQYFFS